MNIPKGYVVSGSNIEEVLKKYEEKAAEIIGTGIKNGAFLKVGNSIEILKSSEYPFNLVFFIAEDEMATLKLQMEDLAVKSGETLDNINKEMGSCSGGKHEWDEKMICIHCKAKMG